MRCSLALLLLFGTLAPVAWAQRRPRPPGVVTQIRGQVRFPQGPAPRVLMTLESDHAGLVGQATTDELGKFTFSQLAPAIYTVKVSHPGYRDAAQRIDLTISPSSYVVLEMQPVTKETPPAVPPEGPQAQVSVEWLSIPEGARKEFEIGNKLLLERKDPGASIAHFRKAIQLHPTFAQGYVLLGTAYMDTSKWKDAQSAFQKAAELDEKLAAAHLALGVCYNQQGNFAAAEKPRARGLELSPEAVQGHYELGRAYWALGRWPEAEPHARKVVSLQPEFAPVRVLLGNIMLRKRDARAALQEFKEYLRLEPNGPLAPGTRDMVSKIEKALADAR